MGNKTKNWNRVRKETEGLKRKKMKQVRQVRWYLTQSPDQTGHCVSPPQDVAM
jgi:hypothetical protein